MSEIAEETAYIASKVFNLSNEDRFRLQKLFQQAMDIAVSEAVVEALAQQKRYNRKKLHEKLFQLKQESSKSG